MIDLDKFNITKEAIVPIVFSKNNSFYIIQYNNRKESIKKEMDDGWYRIKITPEHFEVLEKADEIDIEETAKTLSYIDGFVYANSIIPISFNSTKMKYGFYNESLPIYCNQSEPWECIRCVMWEDNSIFYWKKNNTYNKLDALQNVKDRFDNEKSLDNLKDVTPEMRYLYILFSIDRDTIKEMKRLEDMAIAEEEKRRLRAQFEKTLAGRLMKTFELAGGHLENYTQGKNGNLIINWSVNGEYFNSIIKSNLSVVEAGYCMENDDKSHTLSSMILTAKDYQERNLIYKTRR